VHAVVDLPGLDYADPAAVERAAAALQADLRTRIAGYKVPRTVEFVTEPVRDDAGKVRRSALRDARS